MKKILTIISTVLMMLCFGVTAFAATGSFTSSPSANRAPILVEYENESPECTATVVVYAYSDRHTLDDETRETLEKAYASIASAEDLGDLGYDANLLANNLGVSTDHLYVSDLFEISYENCLAHEDHKNFTITVKPSSVVNYAGFLHYKNGEWDLIESTATEDGTITFTVEDLSPFAIVVHDGSVGGGAAPVAPSTDMEIKLLAALVIFVSLIGIAIVADRLRN